MYTEKDLVAVMKRENNNKRSYLVANRLQSKHIPSAPDKTFEMFDELADIVAKEYKDDKLLIIGFAETATAIGARIAVVMGCPYMQTTREEIEDVEFLDFTESHSHAVLQKLIKTDLDKVINHTDRIVFVEDELTTGNTVMKIIDLICLTYSYKPKFSVVSILNGMNEESLERYRTRNIKLHYLLKTNHNTYTELVKNYKENGKYYLYSNNIDKFRLCMYNQHNDKYYLYDKNSKNSCKVLNAGVQDEFEVLGEGTYESTIYCREVVAGGYINTRRLTHGAVYQEACENLTEYVVSQIFEGKADKDLSQSILVVGTEEFMYPAIHLAAYLAKAGFRVLCHSTTRSPMAVCTNQGYLLTERYELRSVYDDERRTFIYNLDKYDKVIIVTDTQNDSEQGIYDLCAAVRNYKNNDITLVRWGDYEKLIQRR